MDAKEALELRRRQILERLGSDTVEIQPGYHTVREEILRPDRQESETAYFWDRWAPRLGPSATMLVVRMRQACRRAGLAAERDAAITLSYQEIGRHCGMSSSTVKRLLQQDEVRRFIHKEAQMRESVIGMVDAPNRYTVMMTDPLIPEDEEILRMRLADRLLTQELLNPSTSVKTEGKPSNGVQNGRVAGGQNGLLPPVQNDPVREGQNNPASGDRIEAAVSRKRPSIMARKSSPALPDSAHAPVISDMQNVKEHEELNVNVLNGIPYKDSEEVESWAFRMVELTKDEKSINFYRKAARVLIERKAEGVLDHAMGLVKEAIRGGTVRRPAALLTSTLLKLAEDRGILISNRSREEASQIRNIVRQSILSE